MSSKIIVSLYIQSLKNVIELASYPAIYHITKIMTLKIAAIGARLNLKYGSIYLHIFVCKYTCIHTMPQQGSSQVALCAICF